MTITDKQVEAACVAYHHCQAGWEILPRRIRLQERERIVAALEAAEAARDAEVVTDAMAETFLTAYELPTIFELESRDSAVRLERARSILATALAYAPKFDAICGAESAAPSSAEQPASAEYVLRMLVAAGHVTQAKVDEARGIAAGIAPGAPEADERTFDDVFRSAECQRAGLDHGWRGVAEFAWNAARANSSAAPSVAPVPASVRERWNIERDGDALLVCFNDHERSQGCRYERFIPADAAAPVSARDAEAVAWQLKCRPGGAWRECTRETFERGHCGVESHKCEVRALYLTPPSDARDGDAIALATARHVMALDSEDARRYRWLREHCRFANDSAMEIWFDKSIVSATQPPILDAAIDRAMGGE